MNRARRPSARIRTSAAASGRVEGLPDAGRDAGPAALQALGPMPRGDAAGSISAPTSEGLR